MRHTIIRSTSSASTRSSINSELDDFDPLQIQVDSSDDGIDDGTAVTPDDKWPLQGPRRFQNDSHVRSSTCSNQSLVVRFCLLSFASIRQWFSRDRRRWFWALTPLLMLLGLLSLIRRSAHPELLQINGHSPPWYPTPRGGSFKRWEEAYQKAEQLVNRMTLAEKINITTGTGWKNGLCVGNTGPATNVRFPSLCLQDGPLGLRFADNVTAGPAGITVGSTWNRELMYKRGRMLGIEAKMKGINILLGPSVGPIGRTPLGGRNWEGFGVDPVLQAAGAYETIIGIQAEGVMATVKHFVANEQEHFRRPDEWAIADALSSNVDDRTLHELYLWPFAESIRAGVASVMCSYQKVNNSHTCQNSKLLNGILKDELGFQGFVQSDWLAKRSGMASALAGLDMDMPGDGLHWADGESLWGPQLTIAVLNASLPLERLNDMVTRIVAAWYKFGQDDQYYWHRPPPDGDGGPNFSSWTNDKYGLIHPGTDDESMTLVNHGVDAKNVGGFSHSSLARRIAAEGIVLLKNVDHFLPLSRKGYTQFLASNRTEPAANINVGIFGEDSISNPDGVNACVDRGCNKGTLAMGWGSGTAEFPYLISPSEALRGTFHAGVVDVSVWPSDDFVLDNLDILGKHDLCIVFVNADSGEGFLAVGNVKGDRNNLVLDKDGERLIKVVASTCGNEREVGKLGDIIIVVHSVGPVLLETFVDLPNVRAIIWANLPGQESGNALIDVLFGDVNPSGHLPYTIGRSLEDYGPSTEILTTPSRGSPQQNFTEGTLIDYKWFDAKEISPRYEFGYGLSYTTFEIRNLLIETTFDSVDGRPDRTPGSRPGPETSSPQYVAQRLDPRDLLFPTGWRKLRNYVYPYINSVDDIKEGSYPYPLNDGKEKISPSGGGEGGHPALWNTLLQVSFDVVNLGNRSGQIVPQLYVRFPNRVLASTAEASQPKKIEFPLRQLRSFTKIHLAGKDELFSDTGETKRITLQLTRRDLSYWSVDEQNWILPEGQFAIEVGLSSRDLRVRGVIF